MNNPGKAEHGQALFADVKGLACVKCHAVKGQGGAVGPDLSGVGATYPRDELIASVLFPSQKIFSGYEPVIVATNDGRILTGILKRESPEEIEIQDADAKSIVLKAEEIDERKKSDVSLMPSGLAEGLSKEDFADVIAYLESLKDKPAEAKGAK
jgi:putative heme-binding domain-containing protein